MATLPNPRYERKFVAYGWTAADVRVALQHHWALFRQAFPPRSVNNIYVDTPGLSDYHDHVRGAPARAKTRLRWYGERNGAACPTLERKLREGALGGKETYRLSSVCLDDGEPWRGLRAAIAAADLPGGVLESVASRVPSLLNRYDRDYLVSADGRFRITVDSRLRFAAVAPLDLEGLTSAPVVPGVVVELKYEPAHEEGAAAIGQALPFRLARFSKYVIGVELTAHC
jgi:hypothetical protein